MSEKIAVETQVRAPIARVWNDFTDPVAVQVWNAASDDWHTTAAKNDLRIGGRFSFRMEAKDGSAGFDFEGEYTEVVSEERIAYRMDDDREVVVTFTPNEEGVQVVETFDAETENELEMQRAGWQAILDGFKRYCENSAA